MSTPPASYLRRACRFVPLGSRVNLLRGLALKGVEVSFRAGAAAMISCAYLDKPRIAHAIPAHGCEMLFGGTAGCRLLSRLVHILSTV